MDGKYRNIILPNGDILVIKFDVEGVVYDRWSSDMETHLESYGYDLYEDITVLNKNK